MNDVGDPSFWQQRYDGGGDGWELGGPAPPLVAWFRSPAAPPPGRAVVPGCGRGHEVLLLGELGYEAVGVDFADSAVAAGRAAAAERELEDRVKFVQADLFAWTADPAVRGAFDVAVEHTCYCAIDPARRDEYAAAVAALVRPGGWFVGLFWACGRAGGPPYSCTARELERRFGHHFRIDQLTPAAGSIPRRHGEEWLMVARGIL